MNEVRSIPQAVYKVSVMITTRNRSSELRRSLRMLRKLSPAPWEVLITLDGVTDDTLRVVETEFPDAKIIVNTSGLGSVPSRDRMMREATGDLVFALDDDSYPEQGNCLSRVIEYFERNPKLAVIHFPQRSDEHPDSLTQKDFGGQRVTRSFANSGAVFKRSVYLQLAGFERFFCHMYEEVDYGIQCIAAGYLVVLAPDITIRHHYSRKERSELRNHHRHARNEFWSTLLRCPFPYAIGISAYRVVSQFRYACSRGFSWAVREPVWWCQALLGLPYCLKHRTPVDWKAYRQWLSLP